MVEIPRTRRKRRSNSEAHAKAWALVFTELVHIAYLDEFGHIGPFVARHDPQYKTHPVFGLGGFVLPAASVRSFSAFFQNLKCELLEWEIAQSGEHPGRWEKKGSALLTTQNIEKYPEVGKAIKRIFARIRRDGGSVFFYGQVKPVGANVAESSRQRYDHVMIQSIRRLGWSYGSWGSNLMILDEVDNQSRQEALASATGFMFGSRDGRHLTEPPMQVESHLYPTVQCADWICALLGRTTAYLADPVTYSDFGWAHRMFGKTLSELTTSKSRVFDPVSPDRSITRAGLVPADNARPRV